MQPQSQNKTLGPVPRGRAVQHLSPRPEGKLGEWVVRFFKAGEILKGLISSSPKLAAQRIALGNRPRPFINSERVESNNKFALLAPCLNPSRLTFRLGSRLQDDFTGHICICNILYTSFGRPGLGVRAACRRMTVSLSLAALSAAGAVFRAACVAVL